MSMAFGQMGIAPDVFWDMTPREFGAAVHGWSELQKRNQRDTYDAARIVGRAVIQMAVKKGKKVKLSDVAKMPWDDDKRKPDGKTEYMKYETGARMLSLIAKAK